MMAEYRLRPTFGRSFLLVQVHLKLVSSSTGDFVLLLLIGFCSSSGMVWWRLPVYHYWDSCFENGWGRVLSFRVVWHLILGFSPHTDSDVCAVMVRLQSTFPRCMKTSHLGLSYLCWTCVATITHLPCTLFFAAAPSSEQQRPSRVHKLQEYQYVL